MRSMVLGFQDIEKSQLLLVGGKGLNLGLLSKIDGLQVPEGFCVTTEGYQDAIEHNETYQLLLDRLARLKAEDRDQIGEISREIRGSSLCRALQCDCRRFAACLFRRATTPIKYHRQRLSFRRWFSLKLRGILFTADPMTGSRKMLTIDAGFGLGEALVSGLVSADGYKVQDGKIVE